MENKKEYWIMNEEEEINDIIERTIFYTPEERLNNLNNMARFLYDNMTPEGKKIFEFERKKEYCLI